MVLVLKYLISAAFVFTLGIIVGLIGIPPLTTSTDANQSVFAQSPESAEGQRPNILLIVGDSW
jgi:hypothetical protein